jgi:hypothetical protein
VRAVRLRVALITLVVAAALPAGAGAKTVWLCKPGAKPNPCVGSLTASLVDANGNVVGTRRAQNARKPAIDCFYVYPTISDQKAPVSTLSKDPEEISIAEFQAQRFSQICRVFAPMYRQVTLQTLMGGPAPTAAQRALGPRDLVAAWREYLKKYNHGRGVVLIGHSQGSFQLKTVIRKEIDRKPAVRKRIVSALLLGGNVLVKKGKDVGGDFQKLPACRAPAQTGCVIAYSMFGESPPENSLFGRTTQPGKEVLCTNPAALRGGSGRLAGATRSEYPPGTIGLGVQIFEGPLPDVSTPWIIPAGTYAARCSSANGANVLLVTPGNGARVFNPSPDASWGYHLGDINLAVDTLVDDVRVQARAWLRRHR